MVRNKRVTCLLWADDIVLISKTEKGLKNSLTKLENYCNKWKMIVNTDKTKIMIFNKTGTNFKK